MIQFTLVFSDTSRALGTAIRLARGSTIGGVVRKITFAPEFGTPRNMAASEGRKIRVNEGDWICPDKQ